MIHQLDSALVHIDRWSKLAARWLLHLGVYVGLPALVLLVTVDVLLRYVFNAPLGWSRDANGLLLLMTLFSCLPHAWDQGYHIRMEIFYARMSRRRQEVADVLTAFAGIVFFAAMGIQGLRFVPYMMATNETGEDLLIPLWPFMSFMALASFVLCARLLSNPRGKEDADDPGPSDPRSDK